MKTDNSYLEEKILLRLNHLPNKNNISVLDCYAGEGFIWKEVKKRTNKNISVTAIEKEKGKNKSALQGDNLKFLPVLDLSKYDIIDLDAYGIPFEQLEIIFKRGYKGRIFVTAIQTMQGRLNNDLLIKIGYPKIFIDKSPTLFSRNFMSKIQRYLYINNIKEIQGYFIKNKNYFTFKI